MEKYSVNTKLCRKIFALERADGKWNTAQRQDTARLSRMRDRLSLVTMNHAIATRADLSKHPGRSSAPFLAPEEQTFLSLRENFMTITRQFEGECTDSVFAEEHQLERSFGSLSLIHL